MALTESVKDIINKSDDPLLAKHNSWSRIRLGDIAEIINGFAFKSQAFSKEDGIPLIRIRDVGEEKTESKYLGDFDDKYIVQNGDLVIGMDGDFRSARWKGEIALLNQRVCKLQLNHEDIVLEKFLDYSLPGYLNAIHRKTSSVTVKHLSSKSIMEILLPVPPIPEQHRIVDKVEELFTQLDAGMAALQRAQANLKRYRASVLKAACEGRLVATEAQLHPDNYEPADVLLERILAERRAQWEEENPGKKYKEPAKPEVEDLPDLPEGWVWTTVDMLTKSMKNGIYKKASFYSDSGVPCLRMYNIEDGEIRWFDIKRMTLNKEEVSKYQLVPGDILVNRVNSRELVGKSAVIPDGIEQPLVFESKNIRLEVEPRITHSRYLNFWFRINSQSYFNYNAQQVVGMASINQQQVGSMPVPLPPLDEQTRIIEVVESKLSIAAVNLALVEKEGLRVERLRQSILKRAFEGRLVPQDPADKPVNIESLQSSEAAP